MTMKSTKHYIEQRISLDGKCIDGDFLLKLKPSTIYYRFRKRFPGIIKNFRFRPKDLILLSKHEDEEGVEGQFKKSRKISLE